MILTLLASVALQSLSMATTTEKTDYDANGISKIQLSNLAGNIKITGVSVGKSSDKLADISSEKINLVSEKISFEKHCILNVERKNSTLFINVSGNAGWFGKTCDVNFDLQTPKNVSIEVTTGAGDIMIKDTTGDISFVTGAGDTVIVADVGSIRGTTGSGDITITGLTANGEFKTGAGDLKLTYKSEPQSGVLDIKSGAGDAIVNLPKASKLNATLSTAAGELKNDFSNSPESPFKISMKSGAGDLKINKL